MGDCLKREGFGQFVNSRGGGELWKKERVVFLRGNDTLMHTKPLLWMRFNCLKPLKRDGSLFTFKSPEIPGTHFIKLGLGIQLINHYTIKFLLTFA